MPFLNLGIVAHVDAGKTSLTERLLFEAGVVDAPGSVDDGTTRTDSMDLERRRGITIRANVAALDVGDLELHLIDTPGHPDFVAEVERSLAVLDAAVLVLSAVEGVQPQTVVLWRALTRLQVPTLLFVNKIDRRGADVERVLDQIRRRLTDRVAPLVQVRRPGTPQAAVADRPLSDEAVVQAVAAGDDTVLARWAEGRTVRREHVVRALRRGAATPLLAGSAITGAGIPQLRQRIRELLPRAAEADAPLGATVFAVDRDAHGRRAWLRLWSGQLRTRQRYPVGERRPERVTEIAVVRPHGAEVAPAARAGEVALVRGPATWRIGDVVGAAPRRGRHRFAPPTLQALVEPVRAEQRTAMFTALTELADEDPLIDLRLDDTDGEAAISLHGQVQQEIVGALLAERYGVPARFRTLSTVCIERVAGVGEFLDEIGVNGNPYLATIGLRIEPAPPESGIAFEPGVQRGRLPPAFVAATEEGVRAALRQGLHGWSVTDCVVTMTASGYQPRQSHMHQKFSKAMSSVGADFRHLAQVVVMAATQRAGTTVCQPIERFDIDVPDEQVGPLVALLGRLGAVPIESSSRHGSTALAGHVPSARTHELAQALPDLTSGEAVLVTRLDHHAPAPGRPPTRRRSGPNPLNRDIFFRDRPR